MKLFATQALQPATYGHLQKTTLAGMSKNQRKEVGYVTSASMMLLIIVTR
jgi:hypothetical protein